MIVQRLKRVIKSHSDGGDAELVDVTPNGVVRVRLSGACRGCPMSQMTVKMGVQRAFKREAPEVVEVASV